MLFWPYVTLTGHYLSDKDAVVFFFALGFLVAAGLVCAVWRRYFPEVSVWVAAVGILALGLTTGILEVLSHCDVHEVAISCGFAFTMLALAAIWCALHEPKRQVKWLLLASLAYGLAVGSRPSLLFGAIILLVPVAQAWRAATEPGSRRQVGGCWRASVRDAHWVGVDALQCPALRQSIRIWLALPVDADTGRRPPGYSVCIISGSIFGSIFWSRCDGVVISLFARQSAAAFAIGLLWGGRPLRWDTDQLSAGVAGVGRAVGVARQAGGGFPSYAGL